MEETTEVAPAASVDRLGAHGPQKAVSGHTALSAPLLGVPQIKPSDSQTV